MNKKNTSIEKYYREPAYPVLAIAKRPGSWVSLAVSFGLAATSMLIGGQTLFTAVALGLLPLLFWLLLMIAADVTELRHATSRLSRLMDYQQSSPQTSRFINRVADTWSDDALSTIPFAPLRTLIERRFQKFYSELSETAMGVAAFDSDEWFSVDAQVLSCATRSIHAVSQARTTSVWRTPSGRKYWQTNRDCMKRGVKISRTFAYSFSKVKPAERENIISVMKEQADAGVTIYVANTDEISIELCTDMQTTTGETVADTARVLAPSLDALVFRTRRSIDVEKMGSFLPVVNALTEEHHPTQAIADMACISLVRGSPDGTRVLFVGAYGNIACSFCIAALSFPNIEVTLLTPPGYGACDQTTMELQSIALANNSCFRSCTDPAEIGGDYDVVYTTRWRSMGQEKAKPNWRALFHPYRVTKALLAGAGHAGTFLLHDLPAERDAEIESELLDGPRSSV